MILRDDLKVIAQRIPHQSRVLDLGCGDGKILNALSRELQVKPLGIEIDEDNLNKCIASGLSVIQQDIDDGLDNFSDNSFDTVIMSQTIQVLKEPKKLYLR